MLAQAFSGLYSPLGSDLQAFPFDKINFFFRLLRNLALRTLWRASVASGRDRYLQIGKTEKKEVRTQKHHMLIIATSHSPVHPQSVSFSTAPIRIEELVQFLVRIPCCKPTILTQCFHMVRVHFEAGVSILQCLRFKHKS